MEKSQIYAEYEVPPAMTPSITPLENLEEEIAKEITKDPEGVEKLVQRYDAVVDVGFTEDYIGRRGFDSFKSLREIVQNALDENELCTGKPDVVVEKDSLGTWIIDNGRGLKVEALSIGQTDKECWMRGFYGEGLKLAATFFTSKGTPVYVFTRNHVFKFAAFPKEAENSRILALLGRSTMNVRGTKVLLFGLQIDDDSLDKMVSFRNKMLAGKKIAEVRSSSSDCPHRKASAIFDYPNLLYIRNMFVGNMAEVSRRRSLLSYDLWWFRLDVSRTLLTYAMPKLFKEVAKLLEASKEARENLAKKLVETNMLAKRRVGNRLTIEFQPKLSTFEGHLFVYNFPEGMLDAMLKVLHLEDKKDLIARATSGEDLGAVKEEIIPFIVSGELSAEFKRIPSLSERSA